MLVLTVAVAHAATAVAVDACLVPPLLGWHWLPWACIAVVPLTLFALPERLARTDWWRWLAVAVVATAGAWLLLRPMPFSSSYTPLHLVAWLIAAPLIAGAAGWSRSLATTGPFVERAAALIATGAIAAGALATGSKDLALLAAIVPAAIGGGALVAWFLDRGPWTGGTLVAALISGWHLLLATNYSEMPWWNAPLFVLALPAGALASRLGRTPRQAAVWQLGATAAVAGIALAVAATLGQPAHAASDGPDYRY